MKLEMEFIPKAEVEFRRERKTGGVGEFPMFNNCSHTTIDLSNLRTEENDWMHTLSIKLPNGNFVTMCVMQPSDKQSCIDVKFHGYNIEKHRVIGFDKGRSQSVSDQGIYALVLDAKEVK